MHKANGREEENLISHHNERAQLEDLEELSTHALLQVLCLGLGHLAAAEIKHFLTEEKTGRNKINIWFRSCPTLSTSATSGA